MDSQQDLTRSMLKAKLRAQANGGPPTEIREHLARAFTPQEVLTNPIQDPGNRLFGANGLARTLEGALQPMMGDEPFVKHGVSICSIWTLGWESIRIGASLCARRPPQCPPRDLNELTLRIALEAEVPSATRSQCACPVYDFQSLDRCPKKSRTTFSCSLDLQ